MLAVEEDVPHVDSTIDAQIAKLHEQMNSFALADQYAKLTAATAAWQAIDNNLTIEKTRREETQKCLNQAGPEPEKSTVSLDTMNKEFLEFRTQERSGTTILDLIATPVVLQTGILR